MKLVVLKKLTLWEFLLIGLGVLFAIGSLSRAGSVAEEPALELISSLPLFGLAVFIVFGGQLRGHAFFTLLVFVFAHIVMSYSMNVWVDRIGKQYEFDLPPGTSFTSVGSIRRFVFDATVDIFSLLVAARLTFCGVTKIPVEAPAPHAQP